MAFLSGGTTLKGFEKAIGVASTTWASGANLNTLDMDMWIWITNLQLFDAFWWWILRTQE